MPRQRGWLRPCSPAPDRPVTDHYDITIDPQRQLVMVTMRGHWDVETVRAYKRDILAAVDQLRSAGCAADRIIALVDIRDGGAQSQDVIAAYKDDLSEPGLMPRRLATLVSSALFRLQVERIAIPNQRLFTDEAEAFTWLLSPDDAS